MLFLAVSVMSCHQEKKLNIFLIYVDDLRPELGAYGNDFVKSPRIDAFAEDALVFNKAYATIPVCGASRASMLSGIMRNRNRFVGYMGNAQKEVPEAITLPMYLKNNRHHTLSLGKVFHTKSDNEFGWSEKPFRGLY
jgi:iduronate 2-sulfatase